MNDIEAGETTSLLHNGPDNEPPPLQDMKAESLKEKAVAGLGVVGFLSSFASLFWGDYPSVYLSGLLGTLLSPYAALQQRKLTHVEALRQTNERFQEEVDQLTNENLRLSNASQQLSEAVMNLDAMQDTLAHMEDLQVKSLTQLEQQIAQTEQVLASIQTSTQAELLQNLVTVIATADADQDLLLSDDEIDKMIERLEGIHGVQLKEDLLRQTMVQHGRSVAAILEVVRHVLMETDDRSEVNIFKYVEE